MNKPDRFLQEGDIILVEPGMEVYTRIPDHFIYGNCEGNFENVSDTVIIVGDDSYGLKTDFLAGQYIVTKTASDGGGTGHGPHDVYPDGHHVWAQKINKRQTVNNGSVKIHFYQSGCFTATIEKGDIAVVGKAKQKWEVEDLT